MNHRKDGRCFGDVLAESGLNLKSATLMREAQHAIGR
jgi:hypothetical protein